MTFDIPVDGMRTRHEEFYWAVAMLVIVGSSMLENFSVYSRVQRIFWTYLGEVKDQGWSSATYMHSIYYDMAC